ncbi:MAG: phosphomannomutase [Thermodesulfovibrionales bacterium]|nr:phosphomannomutase [Thermodesulfovibrionales bacterium]
MKYKNASECWQDILLDSKKGKDLLKYIEKFARENKTPAKITFGTSGWRGEIGTDFTFHNLRVVISSIIKLFKSNDKSVMDAIGVRDFEDIQKKGVIVGHDNRFLGHEFAMEIIGFLQKEGVKTWYAGEATTPEFSAGIEMLKAACSINLTPSHNPANYAGLKFNPADGGPAGPEITSKIEALANEITEETLDIEPFLPKEVLKVDLTELYIKYIEERKMIDLKKIKEFVNSKDCFICIDNVHGASRGRIQRILGVVPTIKFIRTEDDYLFGGVAPEPSQENMAFVEDVLRSSTAHFKLGFIIDPDGDRIRFADGSMQIPMNYFGAMAFHYLHLYKGIKGIVAKSVGTSNFVNAIACKLGVPVIETKVGFKNFRNYMTKNSSQRAIVAFEESDGISAYNHTLEKDAIFGLLLAIEMVADTGLNLGEYLYKLMQEYGFYYPDRSGMSLPKQLVGNVLIDRLNSIKERYKVGSKIQIGSAQRVIKDIIDVDGIKLIFDDESWLMIRPSGTEPKVRFYIESRTLDGKKAVFEAAEQITKEVLKM